MFETFVILWIGFIFGGMAGSALSEQPNPHIVVSTPHTVESSTY